MLSAGWLPPLQTPRQPRLALPAGAVDCHANVFAPFDQVPWPLEPEQPYTPPDISGEDYLALLDTLGFARGVLVQPAVYHTDCRALLHALKSNPVRLRGVALIEPDILSHELEAMHKQGVCGARFQDTPAELPQCGVPLEALQELAPRLEWLGWHAQVLAPPERLEALAEKIGRYRVPLVLDHMGCFKPAEGLNAPGFQTVLRLLGTGRVWLKLTPYRLSEQYPNYEDLEPFHRALLAANPERLLWGSDWPHAHLIKHMPDVGHLVDLFDQWTGNARLRRRILVDNPAMLYGF